MTTNEIKHKGVLNYPENGVKDIDKSRIGKKWNKFTNKTLRVFMYISFKIQKSLRLKYFLMRYHFAFFTYA